VPQPRAEPCAVNPVLSPLSYRPFKHFLVCREPRLGALPPVVLLQVPNRVRRELLYRLLSLPGAFHRGVDLRYHEDLRTAERVDAGRRAVVPVEPCRVQRHVERGEHLHRLLDPLRELLLVCPLVPLLLRVPLDVLLPDALVYLLHFRIMMRQQVNKERQTWAGITSEVLSSTRRSTYV
jgi:hypothetical protein